jgi:hypothetical protein
MRARRRPASFQVFSATGFKHQDTASPQLHPNTSTG